jgi:hypothetical protein
VTPASTTALTLREGSQGDWDIGVTTVGDYCAGLVYWRELVARNRPDDGGDVNGPTRQQARTVVGDRVRRFALIALPKVAFARSHAVGALRVRTRRRVRLT